MNENCINHLFSFFYRDYETSFSRLLSDEISNGGLGNTNIINKAQQRQNDEGLIPPRSASAIDLVR